MPRTPDVTGSLERLRREVEGLEPDLAARVDAFGADLARELRRRATLKQLPAELRDPVADFMDRVRYLDCQLDSAAPGAADEATELAKAASALYGRLSGAFGYQAPGGNGHGNGHDHGNGQAPPLRAASNRVRANTEKLRAQSKTFASLGLGEELTKKLTDRFPKARLWQLLPYTEPGLVLLGLALEEAQAVDRALRQIGLSLKKE